MPEHDELVVLSPEKTGLFACKDRRAERPKVIATAAEANIAQLRHACGLPYPRHPSFSLFVCARQTVVHLGTGAGSSGGAHISDRQECDAGRFQRLFDLPFCMRGAEKHIVLGMKVDALA